MSSPGDTIQALSHNTIILASATWTSQAFVLGAYNSMSVMVKTDQPGTLTIQWSGDGGINYDNVNSYLISAGISRTVETPVLQKVVQVSFTNSSISNQTYFRLTTYATVTNTSISINSPDNVNVTVTNLPETPSGEMDSATLTPIKQYDFSDITGGFVPNMSINPLISQYPDIFMSAASTFPKVSKGNTYLTSTMLINSGSDTVGPYYVQGRPCTTRGMPIDIRFSAAWSSATYTGSGPGSIRLIGAGMILPGTTAIADFMGFGYFNGTGDNLANFGVIVTAKGSSNFIPIGSWNGPQPFPPLTLIAINGYRMVRFSEMSDWIYFYIMNVNTGLYQLVHSTQSINVSGSPWTTGWGLLAYGNTHGCPLIGGVPQMMLKTWSAFSQGSRLQFPSPTYSLIFSGSLAANTSLVNNYTLSNAIGASNLAGALVLTKISGTNTLASGTSQGSPIIFRVYVRGVTSGGSATQPFASLDRFLYGTGGTFVSGIQSASFVVMPGQTVDYILPPETFIITSNYQIIITAQCDGTASYITSQEITVY